MKTIQPFLYADVRRDEAGIVGGHDLSHRYQLGIDLEIRVILRFAVAAVVGAIVNSDESRFIKVCTFCTVAIPVYFQGKFVAAVSQTFISDGSTDYVLSL